MWEKAEKGTDSGEAMMQMLQAQMGAKIFGGENERILLTPPRFLTPSVQPGFEVGDIKAGADGARRREENVYVSKMQGQVTDALEKKMPGVWKMEYYPFPSSELGGERRRFW